MTKTNPGRFFEDYRIGQLIRHATPAPSPKASVRCITRCIRRGMRCIPRTNSR